MSAPLTRQPVREPVAPAYTAYAQLVRMLLPSSGSLAIYAVDGDLSWCSDGFERPDFRELIDASRQNPAAAEPNLGQVRQSGAGVRALVARLAGDAGQPLGHVLIELGDTHSGAGHSMAASLTRPLLACLASQLALEQSTGSALPVHSDAKRLRTLLNISSVDMSGPSALQELLQRCVDRLGCMSAIFCLPAQRLTEISYGSSLADPEARKQFDAASRHLVAWAQLNNRPMVVNGIDNAQTPFKILSCPVVDRAGQSAGLLALFRSARSQNFELDDVVMIEILSRQAMSIAAQRHDALTGLLNAAAFEHQLDAQLAAADPVSGALCYFDVPELAEINAACGFDAGDELIRELGRLVMATLAADDQACRVSGARFIARWRAIDAGEAAERAGKLADAAAQLRFGDGGRHDPVPLRFGIAAAPGDATGGRHWISAAEIACRDS